MFSSAPTCPSHLTRKSYSFLPSHLLQLSTFSRRRPLMTLVNLQIFLPVPFSVNPWNASMSTILAAYNWTLNKCVTARFVTFFFQSPGNIVVKREWTVFMSCFSRLSDHSRFFTYTPIHTHLYRTFIYHTLPHIIHTMIAQQGGQFWVEWLAQGHLSMWTEGAGDRTTHNPLYLLSHSCPLSVLLVCVFAGLGWIV